MDRFSFLNESEETANPKEGEASKNIDLLLSHYFGEYDWLRRLVLYHSKTNQSVSAISIFSPSYFQDHAKDEFGDFREIFVQIFDVTMFERTMLSITNELLAEGQFNALSRKYELIARPVPSKVEMKCDLLTLTTTRISPMGSWQTKARCRLIRLILMTSLKSHSATLASKTSIWACRIH